MSKKSILVVKKFRLGVLLCLRTGYLVYSSQLRPICLNLGERMDSALSAKCLCE